VVELDTTACSEMVMKASDFVQVLAWIALQMIYAARNYSIYGVWTPTFSRSTQIVPQLRMQHNEKQRVFQC
jgi:hypothetical protein